MSKKHPATPPPTSNVTTQPEPLVTGKDVAKALSVTPRWIHHLQEKGRIPSHALSVRCRRYRLSEVFRALGVDGKDAA